MSSSSDALHCKDFSPLHEGATEYSRRSSSQCACVTGTSMTNRLPREKLSLWSSVAPSGMTTRPPPLFEYTAVEVRGKICLNLKMGTRQRGGVLNSIEALKSGHLPSDVLLRLSVWKTTSDPAHDLSIEQVSHNPNIECRLG